MICITSHAAAQFGKKTPEDRGKDLAIEGLSLYQQNKFKESLAKFEEAERLFPTAQVIRMKGYALVGLQQWLAAADAIEAALKSDRKPLMPADAEDAEDQLAEVMTHLGTLTIKADAPSATVRIDDGKPQELPYTQRLTVGSHRFVVEAKNRKTIDTSHDVVAGPATLTLTPTVPKAPPPNDEGDEDRPPKGDDDKAGDDEEAAKRKAQEAEAARRKAEEAERERERERERNEKPFDAFAGFFPYQGMVGLAAMGVGIAAAGVAAGAGGYGLALESAVDENIALHNQNYDASCTNFADLCRADLAFINRDAERAADFRNVGLASGIAGGSLALIGAGLWLFSPDSPLAKTPEKKAKLESSSPSSSASMTGLGCIGLPVGAEGGFGLTVGCAARF